MNEFLIAVIEAAKSPSPSGFCIVDFEFDSATQACSAEYLLYCMGFDSATACMALDDVENKVGIYD